jgi:hypothetical protein
MPARQRLQSAQWIGNYDYRPRTIKRRVSRMIMPYQGCACAIAEGVGKKPMAVGLLAFQGNKERAGSGAARVGADPVDC